MMKKQKVDAQNLITKIIFKDKNFNENFKYLKALKIATEGTEREKVEISVRVIYNAERWRNTTMTSHSTLCIINSFRAF